MQRTTADEVGGRTICVEHHGSRKSLDAAAVQLAEHRAQTGAGVQGSSMAQEVAHRKLVMTQRGQRGQR